MKLRPTRFALLAVTIAVSLLPVRAQIVGGTISGVVQDPSGPALSNATVMLRQAETGHSRTLIAGGDGRFAVPSVPWDPIRLRFRTLASQRRSAREFCWWWRRAWL